VAAALRFYALGAASMQIDEVMSLLAAAQFPKDFNDVHPPLFYGILHYWCMGGLSEFWLRSSSVLASLLGLCLWWRLVRHWEPERAATCVLMLATAFSDLQQARELRMYPWLQLWSLAYLVCLQEQRKVMAALALAAACFTHVFGLFLIPIGLLKGWSRWLPVVVALWLAWGVPHYLGQRDHPLDLRQRPNLAMELEAIGRLVGGRVTAFGDGPSLGLGALVLLWLAWKRPVAPRLVYAWALLPWLSVWIVSVLTPLQIFEFKYLVWTLPAWIYLLAASTPRLPLVLLWSALNLWGMLPWLAEPHRWMANWRGVAASLRGEQRVIYVHPSMMAAPLLYYGYGQPQLKPVDEAKQMEGGQDMVWVTTLNHPFVAQKRLLAGIARYWQLEKQLDFASLLPSSEIQVSFWQWQQAPPQSKEKQPR